MRQRTFLPSLVLCLAIFFTVPAGSVEPNEALADPALEARARDLSAELRCLVCQNQSIDDSDADLARDLRILVRERLTAGDSDSEVMAYLVSRYGEFVLLRPRLSLRNALLWGAPLALLMGGVVYLWVARGGRGVRLIAPLEPSETEALERRLRGED